jgi:hypothetical protein
MKFISPNGIASQIKDLIDEAEKTLIIVSPYVNISSWGSMKKCLERAVKSGVTITFVMRRNQIPAPNIEQLSSIGIKAILVDDLHAKVYINDKYGIVTSQNMISYSEINSIDIAYKTDTMRERNELVDFVNKFITDLKQKESKEIAVAKTFFTKVDERNFDNKKHLNEYQVEKLFHAFLNQFSRNEFRNATNYIFSDELLPFADVIIDSRYVIKIDKQRTDKEQILRKLEDINFKFLHKFRIEHVTKHRTHVYIEFIPQTSIELQKLIEDYINLSKSILNSEVMNVLKRQQNYFM